MKITIVLALASGICQQLIIEWLRFGQRSKC